MSMGAARPPGTVDNVVARIERLPTSWWHVKTRIIVGVATFFDAFDALAIATVLPVLVPLWKLTPPQIGLLISAGFLGQLVGALLFGWIGERFGRMHGDDLVDRDLRGDELRLRLRLGLQLAAGVPHPARHRPRRRGAGRRGLHQRADARRATAAASCCCTSWCSRSGSSRRACSASGSCRRSAGNGCSTSARCRRSWRCSCAAAAGIAALARGARPARPRPKRRCR